MAPWIQIAKPFSYHFACNCLKTIIGSAFIGHGITVLLATTTTTTTTTRTITSRNKSNNNNNDDNDNDDTDNDDNDNDNDDSCDDNDKHDNNNNNNDNNTTNNNDQKYTSSTIVTVTTTIGFGLFLALPSLMSQIVWETAIPVITATDLAYDISRENAGKVISSASATKLFPKFPKLQFPKL